MTKSQELQKSTVFAIESNIQSTKSESNIKETVSEQVQPSLKSVLDHRKLSIFSGMSVIFETFGRDVGMFNVWLLLMPSFLIITYITASGIQTMICASDYYYTINAFDNNLIPLTTSFLTYPGRGIVWFCCVLQLVVFVRYMGFQRQMHGAAKRLNENIEDYSLLIQNVPAMVPDTEINKFLMSVTQCTIVNLLKIERPDVLPLRQQLINVQQEFLDRLDSEDSRLIKKYSCSLFQCFGCCRTSQYYQKKIDTLVQKINKINSNPTQHTDAVLVTLSNVRSRNVLKNRLNGCCATQFYGTRLKAIKAPKPGDILFQNTNVMSVQRFFLTLASYIIVMFVCIGCFFTVIGFRYLSYKYQNQISGNHNFIISTVIYYTLFIVITLLDLVFRPLIYTTQSFEKHVTYTNAEKSWMLKLYFYQFVNRMSIYYSRNLLLLFQSDKTLRFFKIFSYDYKWRHMTNNGGKDTQAYALTFVLLNNFLDLLEYAIYHFFCRCSANTKQQRIQALKSLPQRYASKYVNILAFITVLLGFCHLTPSTILIACCYFFIQIVVNRIVMFRLANLPVKHQTEAQFFEFLLIAICFITCIFISQSYFTIYNCWIWTLTLCGILALWVVLIYSKYIAKLTIKYCPDLEEVLYESDEYIKQHKEEFAKQKSKLEDFPEKYECSYNIQLLHNNNMKIKMMSIDKKQLFEGCDIHLDDLPQSDVKDKSVNLSQTEDMQKSLSSSKLKKSGIINKQCDETAELCQGDVEKYV